MPKLPEEELAQKSQPKDLKSQIKELKDKVGWSFKKEGNKLETITADKEQKQEKKGRFNEVNKSLIKSLLRDQQGIDIIVDLLVSKVVDAQEKKEVTKEISANSTNKSYRDKTINTYSSYFSIDFSAADLAGLIKTIADLATIETIQKLLDDKNQKAANIFRLAKSLEITREEEKKHYKQEEISQETVNNFVKIETLEALSKLLDTLSDEAFHLLHFKEIEVLEKASLENPDKVHENFFVKQENNNALEGIKQNIALIRLLKAYESENKASNLLLQKTPNLCAVLAKLDRNSLSSANKAVLENYHRIPASNFLMIKEDYKRQMPKMHNHIIKPTIVIQR